MYMYICVYIVLPPCGTIGEDKTSSAAVNMFQYKALARPCCTKSSLVVGQSEPDVYVQTQLLQKLSFCKYPRFLSGEISVLCPKQ